MKKPTLRDIKAAYRRDERNKRFDYPELWFVGKQLHELIQDLENKKIANMENKNVKNTGAFYRNLRLKKKIKKFSRLMGIVDDLFRINNFPRIRKTPLFFRTRKLFSKLFPPKAKKSANFSKTVVAKRDRPVLFGISWGRKFRLKKKKIKRSFFFVYCARIKSKLSAKFKFVLEPSNSCIGRWFNSFKRLKREFISLMMQPDFGRIFFLMFYSNCLYAYIIIYLFFYYYFDIIL